MSLKAEFRIAFAFLLIFSSLGYAGRQALYLQSLIKAADRLVNLQNGDGSWDMNITALLAGSGTGDKSITGLVGEALISAYFLTSDPIYIYAARKSATLIRNIYNETGIITANDAIFLYLLSQATDNNDYKDLASRGLQNLIEVIYPEEEQLLEYIKSLGQRFPFNLAKAVVALELFNFKLKAKSLIEKEGGLLSLQMKSGPVAGAFLSVPNYLPNQDHYWLGDTAEAVMALMLVDSVRYEKEIVKALELLKRGLDFDTDHQGAFPAGYYYDRAKKDWFYVPWRFDIFDHALQVQALSMAKLKDFSTAGADYLLVSQCQESNYEGWYVRNSTWQDNAKEIEYSINNSQSILALSFRLSLNSKPFILMGGWLLSTVSQEQGGEVDFIAWAVDPDGDEIIGMEVLANGAKTGWVLPQISVDPYIFKLSRGEPYIIPSGIPQGFYFFELVAYDEFYLPSSIYPYLCIEDGRKSESIFSGKSFPFFALNDWTVLFNRAVNYGWTMKGDKNNSAPKILAGGYAETEISTEIGGHLNILAAVADLDGSGDIISVEVMINGQKTGIYLYDDGTNGDFAVRDGIYGFLLPSINAEMVSGFAGQYLLEIVATDLSGNISDPWPYLVIR